MSCFHPKLTALASLLLAAAAVSSCKSRKETISSALEEAGFKMTAEDWFRASRENNVEVLKKFLTGGFSKDTRDENGNTALHAAAAAGAEKAAGLLLDRGIPIDIRGQGNRTPLMAGVIANKPPMVKWLLRQGADPKLKDSENFKALMLAVREGSAGSVEELAAYDRDDLDGALLLAALLGRADVIDSLTNYGASVYARMESDGRTPLMVAAENGHLEAVKLLLEIGSSRYTTDAEGRTAAMLAEEGGHTEIAALINREPPPDELAIESPEKISAAMDAFVAAAEGEVPAGSETSAPRTEGASANTPGKTKRPASRPIHGVVLGAANGGRPSKPGQAPVVMRHYRETDVPVEIAGVQADSATLRVPGGGRREVAVKVGQNIPGSNRLYVVRVKRRLEDSKVTDGKAMEVAVVEIGDRESGVTREWISGRASTAHDPIALVEDPATGARYTAKPGQRFKSADGREYVVSDVRPNQIVIEDLGDGSVRTVPLVGPRG